MDLQGNKTRTQRCVWLTAHNSELRPKLFEGNILYEFWQRLQFRINTTLMTKAHNASCRQLFEEYNAMHIAV